MEKDLQALSAEFVFDVFSSRSNKAIEKLLSHPMPRRDKKVGCTIPTLAVIST